MLSTVCSQLVAFSRPIPIAPVPVGDSNLPVEQVMEKYHENKVLSLTLR